VSETVDGPPAFSRTAGFSRHGPLLLILLLLAGCEKEAEAPAAPASTPPERAATQPSSYRVNPGLAHGSIVVQVRARVATPARAVEIPAGHRARNAADAAFCDGCASRGALPDESLVVDGATLGIRNVAVSLRGVTEGLLPPLPPARVDNACCRFAPHVAFAPVGAAVTLKNSDPMSHAVMISTVSGVMLYSVTIPAGETTETTSIDAPGILDVTCPIHSWMRGWIIATRHPYVALTDERGEGRLDRVPAGAQDVVFWLERLGTAARRVEMKANATERVVLTDADFAKR
jgi:hypothetical protein